MTDHEVYLRARLADEEKPLNPGMKAAAEWALEERQIGFRIPELLDEVRKETAAGCAEIARNRCAALRHNFIASEIRRELGLEEWKEG